MQYVYVTHEILFAYCIPHSNCSCPQLFPFCAAKEISKENQKQPGCYRMLFWVDDVSIFGNKWYSVAAL